MVSHRAPGQGLLSRPWPRPAGSATQLIAQMEIVAMSKVRSLVLAVVCVGVLLLGSFPVLAAPTAQKGDDEPACEDDWASLESEEFPGKFKVWTTCTGEYGDDLREMLGIIESFWEPMTEFMGVEPIPDAGTAVAGGDTAID